MDAMMFTWIGIITVLVVLETISTQMVGIWFAIAALVSLILSLFGVELWVQIAVFLALSALLLIFTRPVAKRLLKGSLTHTNADRVIGASALVIHEINNDTPEGQVKVLGQVWTAYSKNGEIIPAGNKVTVISIEGVKVIVEQAPQQ